jgi:hypothetical protein
MASIVLQRSATSAGRRCGAVGPVAAIAVIEAAAVAAAVATAAAPTAAVTAAVAGLIAVAEVAATPAVPASAGVAAVVGAAANSSAVAAAAAGVVAVMNLAATPAVAAAVAVVVAVAEEAGPPADIYIIDATDIHSIESYGHLGVPAMRLLHELGDEAANPAALEPMSLELVCGGALRERSVGLCRGNCAKYRLSSV